MKRVFFLGLIALAFSCAAMVIAAETEKQPGPAVTGPYNPVITYSGIHNADELLFRNRPTSQSWQSIPTLNALKKVTCSDAIVQLQREGKWQGHLNLDGSCGPTAEPCDWILGNRLNYDEARAQVSR